VAWGGGNLPVPMQYSGARAYTFRMRQMKVDQVGIDLLTHDPVVILKDLEGKRYLPILIGPFEATAIALALRGTQVPRPLSHDLMRTMLRSLHATLEQVVIHDIKDSTFFAKLVVRQKGNTQEIDAREREGYRARCERRRPRNRASRPGGALRPSFFCRLAGPGRAVRRGSRPHRLGGQERAASGSSSSKGGVAACSRSSNGRGIGSQPPAASGSAVAGIVSGLLSERQTDIR
jgi:hypothetical protein